MQNDYQLYYRILKLILIIPLAKTNFLFPKSKIKQRNFSLRFPILIMLPLHKSKDIPSKSEERTSRKKKREGKKKRNKFPNSSISNASKSPYFPGPQFLKPIEPPYPYSVMQIKAHDANGHAHANPRILHVRVFFSWNNLLSGILSLAISQPAPHGRTRLQLTRPIKVDLHQRQPARKECLAIQFNGPVCTYPSYAPAALTSHPSCTPSDAPTSGLHRLPTGLRFFIHLQRLMDRPINRCTIIDPIP